MKTLLLSFVLYLTITTALTDPITEGPHHHPIYRYSCNEDKSVTFKGVKGTVWNFKLPKPNDKCTILPLSDDKFLISNYCFDADPSNKNRVAYVSVFDINEGEKQPPTTPDPTLPTLTPLPSTTAAVAVSGRHVFKLTCKDIPDEGVIRYALAETGIKDFEQMREVYNEVKDVDMRFKEGNGTNFPDISEVYIGDMFYMYIKYMGTQMYKIIPVKCSAYKGTFRLNDPTKTIDLWDQPTGANHKPDDCLQKPAADYNIMQAFHRLDAQTVFAQLHGFRFADHVIGNPDEDDVTISCKVKICNICQDDVCGVNRRKKRSSDVSERLHTVNRTIKIKDKELSSNNSDTLSVNRNMATIALIAIVIQMIV